VNAARLTSGSGFLSWPTVQASEEKANRYRDGSAKGTQIWLTTAVILHGQAAPASSSSLGSRQGLSEPSQRNWQTFAPGTNNRGMTPHRQVVKALVSGEKAQTQMLTVDQVFAEEIKGTNRQELWLTPRANEQMPNGTKRQVGLENQAKMWPTITAHTPDMESNGPNGHQGTYLAGAVKQWMTPRACEAQNPPMGVDKRHHGLTHQVTKQWNTPTALMPDRAPEQIVAASKRTKGHWGKAMNTGNLTDQVAMQNWPTPASCTGNGGSHGLDGGSGARSMLPEDMKRSSGKLNPRWVETLMGLPIGWTMPSCTSPQTIAPMSCDSSAMELCQPPQSGLSEFSLAS
jgi:hypothetical protein